jgi:plasmid stabilization system protein ParE
MAFNVIITEPAAEDVDQTVTFIAANSPSAAARWLNTIQHAILSLDEMPYRAAVIPENTGEGFEYRHLIHRFHRIVFRVDEPANTVFVVRVYHSARAPLKMEDLG